MNKMYNFVKNYKCFPFRSDRKHDEETFQEVFVSITGEKRYIQLDDLESSGTKSILPGAANIEEVTEKPIFSTNMRQVHHENPKSAKEKSTVK